MKAFCKSVAESRWPGAQRASGGLMATTPAALALAKPVAHGDIASGGSHARRQPPGRGPGRIVKTGKDRYKIVLSYKGLGGWIRSRLSTEFGWLHVYCHWQRTQNWKHFGYAQRPRSRVAGRRWAVALGGAAGRFWLHFAQERVRAAGLVRVLHAVDRRQAEAFLHDEAEPGGGQDARDAGRAARGAAAANCRIVCSHAAACNAAFAFPAWRCAGTRWWKKILARRATKLRTTCGRICAGARAT